MIEEQHVERALKYLRDSAGEFGQFAGNIKASEHLIKQYKAQAFLIAKGTIAEREAHAQGDARVIGSQHDLENAETEYKTIWAKRKAAELTIEVWRTQSASNRARMI